MVAMQPILDVGKGLLNSTKTTIQDPKVQTSIVALEAVETSPECNKFMAVTFTILAVISTKITLVVAKQPIGDVRNAK